MVNMVQRRNKKNIIIVALLIISGVMAVGYSALSSKLVINLKFDSCIKIKSPKPLFYKGLERFF